MERKKLYKERGNELLRMMKEWTLDEKIDKSLATISSALKQSKKPIISCSWGKDSVTLVHLVHRIDTSVPIVYNDTGVDFPETKEYMDMMKERYNLTVYIAKSEEWTFWKIAEKYGYPDRTRQVAEPKCCYFLKTKPTLQFMRNYGVDLNFVGLTGNEGSHRRSNYIQHGDLYYSKKQEIWKCTPMIWWTSDDVWEYMSLYDIPPHPAYQKYNIPWLGCMPRTGYIGWEQQLYRISPALYMKISKEMGKPPLEAFDKDEVSE